MSETTDTTTADAQSAGGLGEPGVELGGEDLQTLVDATAAAEFTDSFRPPTRPAADEQPAETDADTEAGDEGEDQDDDEGNPKPGREAKLRHRAQTAEAERDALATRLEAMQRSVIDSQVAALGIKPAAVWASGAELADLLDDDGVPDAAKVQAAAAAAREQLGIPEPARPPRGLRSGATATQPLKRDPFVAAFAPKPE